MNMGIGDAYDIGWKLAAVLNGYGGENLLRSYSIERRPVALRNVERSGVHHSVHATYSQWAAEKGPDLILSDTEEARKLKRKIAEHVLRYDGENKDHGIEMGYSFPNSPVVIPSGDEDGGKEMHPRDYIPSTKPGVRAPHIFLADGKTSIFQLYGDGYTIFDFTSEGYFAKAFKNVAASLLVPLKAVHLPDEPHARSIWQRDIVLVRPDGFVSWRSTNPPEENLKDNTEIQNIILISVGQRMAAHLSNGNSKVIVGATNDCSEEAPRFTSSIGNVEQDQGTIEKIGVFQM